MYIWYGVYSCCAISVAHCAFYHDWRLTLVFDSFLLVFALFDFSYQIVNNCTKSISLLKKIHREDPFMGFLLNMNGTDVCKYFDTFNSMFSISFRLFRIKKMIRTNFLLCDFWFGKMAIRTDWIYRVKVHLKTWFYKKYKYVTFDNWIPYLARRKVSYQEQLLVKINLQQNRNKLTANVCVFFSSFSVLLFFIQLKFMYFIIFLQHEINLK